MRKFLPWMLLAILAMPSVVFGGTTVAGAPTLTSINRQTPATSPTNADTLVFRATFNEDVKDVTSSNFAVVTGITTAPTITGITSNSNGLTWDITVSGGSLASGNGSVQLNLANNTNITDFAEGLALSTTTLSGQSYTVDNAAPAAPVVTAIEDDTGLSSTDGITSDGTIIIRGTSEPNATVAVFVNAALLNTTTAGGAGAWSYDNTANNLGQNTFSITAQATDAAGNTGPLSAVFTLVVDTTAPTGAPTINATISTDSGASSTDNITNDTTPTLDGTCSSGARVVIFRNSVQVGVATTSTTTWSFTSGVLADNTYTFIAREEDTAGNQSLDSNSISVTIDNTAPTGTVTINATITTDSGLSATDRITNDTTPTLTGTSSTGARVAIFRNSVQVGAVTATGTAWTFTEGSALGDGTYSYTAREQDLAGNNGPLSAALSVEIDNTAPAAAPTVNATISNDSGADNTDRITNDSTPTLTGTCSSGARVVIIRNSVQVGVATTTTTTWSFTSGALADNSYTFLAREEDTAGNQSADSNSVSVTIDTSAPAAPVISAPAAEIDTNTTPFSITGTAEADALVRIYSDQNNSGTINGTDAVVNSQLLTGGGTNFSINVTLSIGNNDFTATAVDAAGNESAVANIERINYDDDPPTVLSITRATPTTEFTNLASVSWSVLFSKPVTTATVDSADFTLVDVGNSLTGESITSVTAVGASGGRAAQYTLVVNTGSNTPTGSPLRLNVNASGTGIVDRFGNALSGGFTMTATDQFTIDKTAPNAPAITAIAVDTGASATDNITSDTTLVLSGTAENDSSIEVFDGAASLGTTTASNVGAWSFTTGTLAENGHSFTAVATDAAGNSSTASAARNVTIDTTVTAATPVLDASSDSGASNSDRITNDNTPLFTGSREESSSIQLFADPAGADPAVVVGTASGAGTTFSITATTLTDGTYSIFVRETDRAGNVDDSNSITVVIDTVAPTSTVPDLAAGSDTGTSPTDDLTNDTTPSFDGNVGADTQIAVQLRLTAGGTLLGSANTGVGSTWSITASPAFTTDGTIQVFARATDLAGNTSDSGNFSFELDTTGPTVSAPDLTAASDSGLSNVDDITNLATLSFIGTAEADVSVRLFQGATPISTPGTAAGGNWSLSTTALLNSATPHTVFARATDAAGNSTDSATLDVTVDTVAPLATSLISDIPGPNPRFSSAAVTTYTLDFNEAVGLPNIADFEVVTGTLITGASVVTVATVSSDIYTISVNTGTGDDTLQLNLAATATITDVAGNAMTALPVLGTQINIDKTVPTITNVTSTKADSITPAAYTAGEVIDIQVSFSETIFGTGVQQLVLNTGGGNTRIASSISTNANVITFRYTVQNDDFSTDLDYVNVNALQLNGGTIRDIAANNANVTLFTPGTAGSLGANKNLRIDAKVPTLTVAPQSIAEDAVAASIAFTVSDDISAAVDLAVSVLSSSNPNVPLSGITLDGTLTGTNRALLVTPDANFNGSTNITIRVADQQNNLVDVPVTVTVTPVNDAPVLAGNNAGSPNFSEPATITDGTAVVVEPTLTSSDPDNGALNQFSPIPAGDQTPGTLTVVITNGEQGDQLTISNTAPVSVAGTTVSVSSVAVGTVAGGTNGTTPLTVTFDAGTNFAQAQAVMRAVTYRSVSQRPAANTRNLNFTLTDASGAASAALTESVVVLEGNDPVSITSSGKLPVVTFDASFATDQIPGVALPGQTLTFTIDGKDTDDPITFEWDFGDGTTNFTVPSPNNNVLLNDGSIVNFSANTVTNTVTHTFAKSGIYTVKVVAKDGRTSDDTSATLQIIVNSPPRLVPDTGGGTPPDAERGLTALTDFLKLGQPQTYTVFLSGLSATTDEDGDPLTFTFDLGDGTTVTQGNNAIDKIYPLLPQQAVLQPNGLSSIVVNVTITDTPAQVGIPAGSLTLQRQIFFTEPITGAAVDDIDVFNPSQGLKALGINSQGNRGAVIQFDVVNAIDPRLQIIPIGAETGPAKDFYSPAQDAIPGLKVTNSPAGTFRFFVQFKKAGMFLAQITDTDGRVVRKMIPVTQPDISGAERELQDFNVQASFITGKLNFGTQKQDQLAFRARFPLVDNSLYTFDRTKDFELVIGIGNIACTLNVTPKGKATIVTIRDAKGNLRQPSKGSAVRFKAPKSTTKEALAKNPKLVQAVVDFKLIMEDIELAGLDTEGVTQSYGQVTEGTTVLNTGGLISGQTGDSKIDVKDTGVEVTETMVTLKKNSFVPIGIQALFLVDRQLAYASKIPAGFVTKKNFGQLAGKK